MSKIQITGSEQTTLDKRGYRLLKKLGEGTFAKVYLGEFRTSNDDNVPVQKLACKIINSRQTPAQYKKKFLGRELNILAHCSHPHIIAVHSIFMRRHKFFIFMRHAERGDMYDLLRAHGAVAEPQARIWIRQLALALEYLHVLDIAHRDLKVENVLVTENFNIKLSDFGFARSCVNENGENVWSETFCGSLAYVAPEILKGNPYRPKVADMWSFGVVVYTMLNKGNPFVCTDMATLYRHQTKRQWHFRRIVQHKVSDEMKLLVRELLEPDVLKRINVTCVLRNPLLDSVKVSKELLRAEQEALRDAYSYKQKCRTNKSQSEQGDKESETMESNAEDSSNYKSIGADEKSLSTSKSTTLICSKGNNPAIYDSDAKMSDESSNAKDDEAVDAETAEADDAEETVGSDDSAAAAEMPLEATSYIRVHV